MMGFIDWIHGPSALPRPNLRALIDVPARVVLPSGRVATVIRPNSVPFHEERGWRRHGSEFRGYYRTRKGSFEGRIRGTGPRAEYFILHPPVRLVDGGPHAACFRQRGPHTFFIHWSEPPRDVDTGILRVEHCILESLS
ncbi:MAG: hypothetical protein JNK58_03400 [Phycisphaerae bacterium]|nr:hypothetical protein [Phycisphaerae bacterium]